MEFDYFLAAELGMFVSQVRQMSNLEMVGWRTYFAKKNQREELELAKAKMGRKK